MAYPVGGYPVGGYPSAFERALDPAIAEACAYVVAAPDRALTARGNANGGGGSATRRRATTVSRKRKANPFRPGTASYAKRRTELKQQELNRASRIVSQTKNPETRQRSITRATRARTTIKKIETVEKARSEYGKSNKVEFSRRTIREQTDIVRQAKEVAQLITPEGFPKDIDVEVSEKKHNLMWALAYNEYRSKAGNRLRA